MPNQRASNKKLVTNWFTTAEIQALRELAAERGVDVTTLFRERKMKTIAFAIVIAACLFSPTKHDCLLGWSIFGLWFATLCEVPSRPNT